MRPRIVSDSACFLATPISAVACITLMEAGTIAVTVITTAIASIAVLDMGTIFAAMAATWGIVTAAMVIVVSVIVASLPTAVMAAAGVVTDADTINRSRRFPQRRTGHMIV
jgi:hypothetical protein